MNVLTTSTDSQFLNIVPRSVTFDELIFTDDSTNTPEVITIVDVVDKVYYQQIEIECALIENHYYNVELFNDGDLVFRGKVFCTDQPVVSFSVNNSDYTSHTSGNEFIVYE
jgi:hypothetical protein